MGLSFKPGTDDLRQSPMLEVAEALLAEGCHLRVYDPNIWRAAQTSFGAERLARHAPWLPPLLLETLEEAMEGAEAFVVAHREAAFEALPARYPGRVLIDLARVWETLDYDGLYEGIAWRNINHAQRAFSAPHACP